jgi:hypothetical protein
MNKRNSWFWAGPAAIAIASGSLMVTTPGYAATDNAQERRDARDVKQDSRQGARKEKTDCRKADEKSNSECRQEKRSTKQTGRQDSRDVRSGSAPKP